MTYRERREARADRLRGWAEKREAAAGATFAAHEQFRGDHAFNFQPGHIPERARVIAREDRAFESLQKAASMTARAENIERAAAAAIYSDDPDATERLAEKIADLEMQRARIVAYNASCRAAAKTGGHGDLGILKFDTPAGLRNLQGMVESCARAGQLKPGWALPAYATTNLSGNISRLRERLARLAA